MKDEFLGTNKESCRSFSSWASFVVVLKQVPSRYKDASGWMDDDDNDDDNDDDDDDAAYNNDDDNDAVLVIKVIKND